MRESHETPLTNEQRDQILKATDTAKRNQRHSEILSNDHALRKWSVEMAIKAVGTGGEAPAFVVTQVFDAADAQQSVREPTSVRFAAIAMAVAIYDFVNAPLAKLNGDT